MNSLSDRFKNALGKGRKASTTERSDLENPTLANIQSDSLFIRKLPYDIRRIIYDDLLQSLAGTLHVNFHPNKAENRYDKRPMHTHCQVCLCKNPGESSDIAYEDCCNGFWTGDHLACGEDAKHHTHCKKSTRNYRTHRPEFLYLQSLLLTCRAVYAEVVQLLYSGRTFNFVGLHSARHFLSVTPSCHLNQIWSINISWLLCAAIYLPRSDVVRPSLQDIRGHWTKADWRDHARVQHEHFVRAKREQRNWEETCQYLLKMKGLVNLVITIYDNISDRYPVSGSEKDILKPLMKFSNPSDSVRREIQIPWAMENGLDFPERSLPFQLTRRPMSGIQRSWSNEGGGIPFDDPSPWIPGTRSIKDEMIRHGFLSIES